MAWGGFYKRSPGLIGLEGLDLGGAKGTPLGLVNNVMKPRTYPKHGTK